MTVKGKRHWIEEDLEWFELGIPELVLRYEIECYLEKQARFEQFEAEREKE